MTYHALKQAVRHGRRDEAAVPPTAFLDALIDWGRGAPDEIFSPKGTNEIYVTVLHYLGPYDNVMHRRAVMLEVMRVLAGHESEWNWRQGVDSRPQAEVKTALTTEAGAWQVSANSMALAPELRHLVHTRVGSTDPIKFQHAMKKDHVLAMEYIARSLRNRIDTHGPVVRCTKTTPPRGIGSNLSRDAVKEFLEYLDPRGSDMTFIKGHFIVPYRSMGPNDF
jgi:hypothetical protein